MVINDTSTLAPIELSSIFIVVIVAVVVIRVVVIAFITMETSETCNR